MDLSATRRRLLTVTGVAAIGYTLPWIAGLSVPAGVLLLIFITGAGITLGTSTNQPISDAPAARKADADVGVLS
jgi:hypothetical protein